MEKSNEVTKKGQWKNTFSVIFIIAALIISAGVVLFKPYINQIAELVKMDIEISELKIQRDTAHSTLKIFLEREQRLRNIQITLLATYQLTQYEARYYSIIFDDFSLHYDIPWEIYASLVRIESNFNGGAESKSHAKGLTQVLEGTAKDVCKKLGIKYKENQTLWSDVLNMVIGFTYLSEGIKDKGFEHGVKKYIGGPGWSKTQKRNGLMSKYIRKYRTTVDREFVRNQLIYKGISSCNDNPVDLYSVLRDPLKVDSLFIGSNYYNIIGIKDDKN